MFENELTLLAKHETNPSRTPLNEAEILSLKAEYPGLPEDYFRYLKEVGWGSIFDSGFMVYGEPMTLPDLDILEFDELNQLLLFGDNFAGDFSAFDPNDGFKVVEIWHESWEIYDPGQTFREYMEEQIKMRIPA